MPFKSKAQQRFMFAAEGRGELPKGTAERWAEHTPDIKALPERKKTAAEIADGVTEKISAWYDEETRAKRRANCPAAGNPELQDARRKANRKVSEERRASRISRRQNNKTASEIADVVFEKIAKAMSWSDSFWTNPFQNEDNELSQIVPLSGALGGLGTWAGSGALIRRKLKEGHPAIPTEGEHQKLLDYAEAKRDIPSNIVNYSDEAGRGGGQAFLDPKKQQAVIRVSPQANTEELSHELGHAEMMFDKGKPTLNQRFRRFMIPSAKVLRHPQFLLPMSGLGIGLSEVGYNRDNTALTDAGLIATLGPHIPTLLEEGTASIKGYNMMRAAGLNPKLRKYLLPFATYGGLATATSAYPAYLSYKQHTRED